MARERICDRAVRAGRMKKEEQFFDAAMAVKELADPYFAARRGADVTEKKSPSGFLLEGLGPAA